MDVDGNVDSDYRALIDEQDRYIAITPGIYNRETLSISLDSLPILPDPKAWSVAYISRDQTTKELKTSLSKPQISR